jgi:hypothetical protein
MLVPSNVSLAGRLRNELARGLASMWGACEERWCMAMHPLYVVCAGLDVVFQMMHMAPIENNVFFC